MPNFSAINQEDARRRHVADMERQRDQQNRLDRESHEQRQRLQLRREAADDRRRQQTEFERRRPL